MKQNKEIKCECVACAITQLEKADNALRATLSRLTVVSAEVYRRLLMVQMGMLLEPSEMVTTDLIGDIEEAILQSTVARDALLAVLMKTGELETNVDKAKRTIEALDRLEAEGRFDGLSDDEKELERQVLGMHIRAGMVAE